MREWLYALVLEVLLMLEVKSEMGKWEMNTFSIGFPYFSTFAFVFLSSFSTRMVFKKINTLLILMVVGMQIVIKNVVVLEEVHDG